MEKNIVFKNAQTSDLLIEQHFHGCYGVDFSTCGADEILELSKKLSPDGTLDYNLADRVIRMFCGFTGIDTLEQAKEYIERFGSEAENIAENKTSKEDALKELADFAKETMENKQKELLNRLDVHFDKFYSELTLHKSGKVVDCLEKLKKNGFTYEQDGALWFKSSQFGDSQDRVLIKNDGAYTYLSADIAYHIDKLERGTAVKGLKIMNGTL